MAKAMYVEATADGYYGGKRVAGSRFWLADGKAEFSRRWMKELDASEATEAAPRSDAAPATDKGGNGAKA